MVKEILLEKLAELAVKIGANVQKDQLVFVNSSTENKELARKIVKHAYLVGARKVVVNWRDDFVSKFDYIYQTEESLKEIPNYIVDKYKSFIDKKGCVISIASSFPDLNKDVDPKKLQAHGKAAQKALSF